MRTFLIADIRGYTTYTRENGDEAAAALVNRFAAIVAEIAAARDGFLLEMRGDEALVAFVSARKALRAAVDLQARFAEEKLPRGVGIGLDAGEAIPVGDGYRGTSLNLAARLCAQAAAGETLASEAVMHLAAKIDGISYVDARDLKLKGYTQSVRAVVVLPTESAKGHRMATDRRQVGRSRAAIGLITVAALAVAAVLVGSLVLNGQPRATPTPAPTSLANASPSAPPTPTSSPDLLGSDQTPVLAFYDAATGKLKGTTSVAPPRNISAFAGGAFWILTEDRGAVQFQQIDPLTNTIAQPINVPLAEPHGFAFDDDYIWITDLGRRRSIASSSGPAHSRLSTSATTLMMTPAGDVTVGDGSVWLSRDQHDPREITRIDRVTGKIQAQIPVEVFGLTYGADALWYWHDGFIGRIDPATNKPAFDEVELSPDEFVGNIYIAAGDAWTDSTGTGKVYRVDSSAATRVMTSNRGSRHGTGRGCDVGHQFRYRRADWHRLHHRPKGPRYHTGHAVTAVTSNGDEVMVAVGPTADEVIAKLPGSTLTMAANGIPWWNPAPDPPLAGDWQVQQLMYLSCVNLVTHPDAEGGAGLALVPEVAAAMPSVSADGRTYTFTIKPGFKFSPPSNEAVTAETFRYSFQRALDPLFDDNTPGPFMFGDIQGAKEYREGTATSVSGLVVAGDQLQITLVAPAPDFIDRLATSAACPVPISGTPALRSGLKPFPPVSGAGPYYLAQTVARRLVVYKKNPNYSGDRPQPFDNIAIHNQVAPDVALGRVESGQLDAVMFDPGDTLSGAQSDLAAEWAQMGHTPLRATSVGSAPPVLGSTTSA